jgi:hypothetical protein
MWKVRGTLNALKAAEVTGDDAERIPHVGN